MLDLNNRTLNLVGPLGSVKVKVKVSCYATPPHNWAMRFVTDNMLEEPVCTASVNPPDGLKLPTGQIAIKDWSENEGVLPSLLATNWFKEEPVRIILSGHVEIYVLELR